MVARKTSGFTLIELLVVISIIGILMAMLLPAVQSVRSAARRVDCLNRIRQLGLATVQFHDVNKAFPPARLFPSKFAKPPYDLGLDQPSWLVRILPYIEQNNFYQQWDLSAAYNDHPGETVSQSLEEFVCPERRSAADAQAPNETILGETIAPCGCGGWTEIEVVGGATGDYAGNHGDLSPGSTGAETDYYYGGNGTGVIISSRARQTSGGQLTWIDRIRYSDIVDGTSNTILAGELHVTNENLNTIPFNGPIYNGEDLAAFTRIGGPGVPILPPNREFTSVLGFGSWHPGSCNFVFADGRTQTVANEVDTVTLGQLCHRKDGGVIRSGY